MIGQICHHFGWTFDYVLWEIDWRIVQRMLIDIPEYKTEDNKNKKDTEYQLTEQNASELAEMLEKYK